MNIEKFLFAGRAIFTLRNQDSERHFTYKVQQAEPGSTGPHFVRVRTDEGWTFLGTIFHRRLFKHSAKSTLPSTSPQSLAFAWLISNLWRLDRFPSVSIHHEGKCGRCGRGLTRPESIESGFGPECIKPRGD